MIIVFLLFAHNCLCDDIKKDEKAMNILESVAVLASHPEIAAGIELLKNFKTESSTSISNHYEQSGFIKFNNINDCSSGAIYTYNFNKLVSLWLTDPIFEYLQSEHKNVIIMIIKEYALQVFEEQYKKNKMELNFNDGKGSLFMLTLYFEPHQSKADIIKWGKCIIWSEFEPAPSYVIITKNDCNIIKCKSRDTITYLPTTINNAHLDAIKYINLNFMSNSQQNLIDQ